MAEEYEELLVTDVEIGIGTVDFPADGDDEGGSEEDVVIEQITASDARTGEKRNIMLVYGVDGVPAMADALRAAAEAALRGD